jgi:hypothetical protein
VPSSLSYAKSRSNKKKRKGHEHKKGTVSSALVAHVILATQEAEIRRIADPRLHGQIIHQALSCKNPSQNRAGGVTQDLGPELKPQY